MFDSFFIYCFQNYQWVLSSIKGADLCVFCRYEFIDLDIWYVSIHGRHFLQDTLVVPCLKPLGASLGWLQVLLPPPQSLTDASSSPCTFPAPTWSLVFFHGALVPFRREWCLGPAVWVPGWSFHLWMELGWTWLCSPGPLSRSGLPWALCWGGSWLSVGDVPLLRCK